MPYKPFLIADKDNGLQLDNIPALIADDAYVQLVNAYRWRKRTKRKLGAQLLGRLRREYTAVSIGNSPASATWSFNLRTVYNTNNPTLPIAELPPIAQLQPGSVILTDGTDTFTDQGDGTLKRQDGDLTSTINYATWAIVLNRTVALANAFTATFAYFPGQPVMGLLSQELQAINAEATLAFDQTYAYLYDNTNSRFKEAPSIMVARWHGTDANFFWGENTPAAIFVTNGTAAFQGYAITNIAVVDATHVDVTIGANAFAVNDYVFFYQVTGMTQINGLTGQVSIAGNPIRVTLASTAGFGAYVNGGIAIAQNRSIATTGDGVRWYDMNQTTWANFQPPINATNILIGALIIFYYRDRLVMLQPIETTALGGVGNATYYQRARWSQNGTFYYSSNPIPGGQTSQSDSWRDDIPGKGGYIDAPTSERIISASLIKDNLQVFFERSTWRLRYSGNEELPFIWERINEEFGSDSTFGTINFDIGPKTIGSRGIIQTDGRNVSRIDQLIPDEVFNFENQHSGPQRVAGIRDFDEQVVYWAFPNDDENGTYPNRVLLYNYMNTSWAIFRDSYTAFGYWQSFNDLTWGGANFTWGSAEFTWGSAKSQALYPTVIGGNQQGYVMKVQEITYNEQSLRIENITAGTPVRITSTNHNLTNDDYVIPIGIVGNGSSLNGTVYGIQVFDANNFDLYSYSTASLDFDIPVTIGAGTYGGAGEIRRVDNFIIQTKKFNPALLEGAGSRLGWVDFYVDVTEDGAFIVNLFVDDNDSVPVNLPPPNPTSDPAINSNSNVVETFLNAFETTSQDRVWHTLYNECTGTFFQLQMTMSPTQLNNIDVIGSDFVMHAINLWVERASTRLS